MKKVYLSLVTLIISFIFLSFNPVHALTETITQGPIFQAGESIDFTDTVDGDVFLFGSQVTTNATVSGDLIIFAGQANINGTVEGDLRVFGGQIDLSAKIHDDVTLAAGQIKLTDKTHIQNTLTTAAGATALNGQVDGKAWLNGGQIDILSQARLGNDLKIYHQADPSISPQARISGDLITQRFESGENQGPNQYIFGKTKMFKKFTAFVVIQKIVSLAIEILIGALLISLLPKLAKKLTKLAQIEPSKNIGWGFLTVIVVPILSVLLFISLIGIPIAVVVLMLYGISFYLARVLAGVSLGNQLLKDKQFKKSFHDLALGLLILSILKLIPIFGWLVYFFFILNGLGALALHGKIALKTKK